MLNIARLFLAGLLYLGCVCVQAQSSAGTTWDCWYGGDTFVHCLLQSAGTDGVAAVTAATPAGRPIPAIVQTIRRNPIALKDQPISIPMHTDPYDMDFVRQLAQSVMCGAQSGCTVDFEPARRVSRIPPQAFVAR